MTVIRRSSIGSHVGVVGDPVAVALGQGVLERLLIVDLAPAYVEVLRFEEV